MLKNPDHLFEWHLSIQLSQNAVFLRPNSRRKKKSAPVTTDLAALHLLYNDRAELDLADVKPIGFLVKSKA
jgi:hypothetical protein